MFIIRAKHKMIKKRGLFASKSHSMHSLYHCRVEKDFFFRSFLQKSQRLGATGVRDFLLEAG